MKKLIFSAIKNALIKIFSDRNVQLTIACFGIGLILALTSTIPILEERIENGILKSEDEIERIEARLALPYDEHHEPSRLDRIPELFTEPRTGLKNASLELQSELNITNAKITILDQHEFPIETWTIKNGENKVINMTNFYEAEYIELEVEKGELKYTYTTNHYIQPYSFLSIPAFILMSVSIIFLIRAVALMGPIHVDEKEKDKIRDDQKVIKEILKERAEDKKRKNKDEK